MAQSSVRNPIWLGAGLRTPFGRVDSMHGKTGAIELSVPVVQAMMASRANYGAPDFAIWGTVAPNLGYSNIAREVMTDAGADQTIPAWSTVMACSTSMSAAFQAAALVDAGKGELALAGGVESMSRVQIGLTQDFSDWLRRFFQARSMGARLGSFGKLPLRGLKLHIPSVSNRTTGLSMGQHCELMAKEWNISRSSQDELALASHERAVNAKLNGFFDDLLVTVGGNTYDNLPRADTSLERLAKLKPAFDRASGKGTLTAGNSSPLTDGAAGVWVANDTVAKSLANDVPCVRLLDYETAAVDITAEGLLMAPSYAIARLLKRNDLAFDDIALFELHEAFAAQVHCNIAAIESREFLRERVAIDTDFGEFPWDRLNPNGGSLALGHPFGATGARILSQAVKELASMASGSIALVSVCADGGLGTVCLLQNP